MDREHPELPPEYRENFIIAIGGHPYIRALRQTRADGDIIRIAAHNILDSALDAMAIPRDHIPESQDHAVSSQSN